jgi:glucose/arabinose dehydrogenase
MERRTLLKAGLLAPAVASVGLVAASPAQAAPRAGATLATGLNLPWGIDFLPDKSALVTERNSGRVLRVRPGGGYSVVGTVAGTYNDGGEGGLMGLALSPTFATDHLVYMFVTTTSDNRVIRAPYVNGALGTPEVVLGGIPSGSTHNGGGLWFSSYPSLFVSTGDTRDRTLAQNKNSLAGKILRLKPDGSAQSGNPFGNRVYTFGHRNPEGITINGNGKIWASEFGENTWDELNRIQPGKNYGWPKVEGADGAYGATDPFAQWHPVDCSPSGIAISRDHAWLGALRGQCLWGVDLAGKGAHTKVRYFYKKYGRIRLVKRAPDGSLWIGTSNGGNADKIVHVTFA